MVGGEVQRKQARISVRPNLLQRDSGFGQTDLGDFGSFAPTQHLARSRFAVGSCNIAFCQSFSFGELRISPVAGHFDINLGLRQLGLFFGRSLRVVQILEVLRSFLLFLKCCNLFFRKSAHAELIEQTLDRIFLIRRNRGLWTTDQYSNAVDVEFLESLSQLFGCPSLNVLTMGEQVQHVRGLRYITEIRRQNRIESLRNQPAYVSESLDNAQ